MVDETTVSLLVGRSCKHRKISDYYQILYPNTPGYCERSIQIFCRAYNIRQISDVEINSCVENFISLYRHRYGRSMMQGSIWYTLGISSEIVSLRRIARSLKRLAPSAYEDWTHDALDRISRIPYFAPYLGYKGHMDKNEKIPQENGCTHAVLIDACSRMI